MNEMNVVAIVVTHTHTHTHTHIYIYIFIYIYLYIYIYIYIHIIEVKFFLVLEYVYGRRNEPKLLVEIDRKWFFLYWDNVLFGFSTWKLNSRTLRPMGANQLRVYGKADFIYFLWILVYENWHLVEWRLRIIESWGCMRP